ncbi:MAG: hypothetical protein ACI9W2_003685, partial [Gammaproteobacteria bacterium]
NVSTFCRTHGLSQGYFYKQRRELLDEPAVPAVSSTAARVDDFISLPMPTNTFEVEVIAVIAMSRFVPQLGLGIAERHFVARLLSRPHQQLATEPSRTRPVDRSTSASGDFRVVGDVKCARITVARAFGSRGRRVRDGKGPPL